MARKPRKPKWVDEAADRAEMRSAGLEPHEETKPESSALAPKEDKRSGAGRPTEYKPKFVDKVQRACANGATIFEIAQMLGVTRTTIYKWMAAHDEFANAIEVGRELADRRVEVSLYERAVGYSYEAVKIMQYEGSPVIVPYVEHVPPDVGAIKHWVANRMPDKWRDHEAAPKGGDVFVTILQQISASPRKLTVVDAEAA